MGGVGVVGVVLETITVTADEMVVFPAASLAVAVRVWEPLGTETVYQVPEYGGMISSELRLEPSSLNWTPATPTLSEAVAETVTLPETVVLVVGRVIATVGEVMSGTRVKVAVTVVLAVRVVIQVPVPEHEPPDQPWKVEPVSGVAVRVTEVLAARAVLTQVEPQERPPTFEVTVPLPVPAGVTLTV